MVRTDRLGHYTIAMTSSMWEDVNNGLVWSDESDPFATTVAWCLPSKPEGGAK